MNRRMMVNVSELQEVFIFIDFTIVLGFRISLRFSGIVFYTSKK